MYLEHLDRSLRPGQVRTYRRRIRHHRACTGDHRRRHSRVLLPGDSRKSNFSPDHRSFSTLVASEPLPNETVRRHRCRHASRTSSPTRHEATRPKSRAHPRRLHQSRQAFVRRLLLADEEIRRRDHPARRRQSRCCRSDRATHPRLPDAHTRQLRQTAVQRIQRPITAPLSSLDICRRIYFILLVVRFGISRFFFFSSLRAVVVGMQTIFSVILVSCRPVPLAYCILVSSISNSITENGGFSPSSMANSNLILELFFSSSRLSSLHALRKSK